MKLNSKISRFVFLFVNIFFIVAAAMPLFAQTAGTGAITGTVTDSTGAVIPGAAVQATNADTGQQRIVNTGADGTYRFALLPPGDYNVKFNANGFKAVEVSRLTVNVSETPVLDRKLELGTQTEQVTVEANAEAIQTANSALGSVIAGTQVTALPLVSRNYTNIMALSAGVEASVTNANLLGKGGMNMSVNGGGTGQNNMQIDGQNISTFTSSGTNADTFNTNGTTPVPNPDSLQEFKVQTSSYDAGSGRNAGANVNIITKSGTNVFHGSAFEFLRNTVLNANDFFLNRQGKTHGILDQNIFGGTLGGPIKKDKLFFFGSYQGTRQKNGVASQGNSSVTLPPIPLGPRENTAAFRAALGEAFCPATHAGTNYQTIRGGVQVACDGSNIHPTAILLLQGKLPDGSYIMPSSPNGTFLTTNFSIPARYTENQELVNADYILSSKHTLAFRFFNSYAPAVIQFVDNSAVPGFTSDMHYHDNSGLMKMTSVLRPAMVNEIRMSYHRDLGIYEGNRSGLSTHQFGITPISQLDYLKPGMIANFIISGVYDIGNNGPINSSDTATNSYQLADEISWTRGKQTIRVGFELEQIRWSWNFWGEGSGKMTMSRFPDFLIGRAGCVPSDTACSPTNPTLTNGQLNNGTLYSNVASSTSTDALAPSGDPHGWRVWDVSSFVNDDIKLTPRLTINAGLRYEYFGMLNEIYGIQTNIWPSAILKVPVPGTTAATGTLAGWVMANNYKGPILPGLTRADNNFTLDGGNRKYNFAPRLGLAWQPFGGNKFVVRAGGGFFYDRVPGYSFAFGINNGPPIATPATHSGVGNYPATLAKPWFINDGVEAGTPVYGTYPLRWADFAKVETSGIQQQTFGSDWITPLVYNWNLGIQWNFLPSLTLEAAYVGSHGMHEAGSYNQNTPTLATKAKPIWGITTNSVSNSVLRVPYLGFGTLSNQCSCDEHRYHSLQSTLRKQFSHGVQAQAAFTWSKNMAAGLVQGYGPYNLQREFTVSGRPYRLSVTYSWNLPFGNPKGLLGKLVTGWNASGVTTIQSGTYLSISDSLAGTLWGTGGGRAQIRGDKTYGDIGTPGNVRSRLGGVSGGCGYFASPTATGTLDGTITCASLSPFTTVPTIVWDGANTGATGQGNMGSGVILGPGQFNFDAALVKNTKVGGIHEDATLQLRIEGFNAMNHAQFSGPTSGVQSATFGQITGTTVNARIVQFALKYSF